MLSVPIADAPDITATSQGSIIFRQRPSVDGESRLRSQSRSGLAQPVSITVQDLRTERLSHYPDQLFDLVGLDQKFDVMLPAPFVRDSVREC